MQDDDEGILGVDWDGDGRVDQLDDMMTMLLLEEEEEELFGEDTGGCYVATCVYGSYDCPPVWILRRYRDERLARSVPGRMFIRLYYALSPAAVRRFGQKAWFRRFWRRQLDGWTKKLKAAGYDDTPYRDRPW